jgi:hypothetical protein
VTAGRRVAGLAVAVALVVLAGAGCRGTAARTPQPAPASPASSAGSPGSELDDIESTVNSIESQVNSDGAP